MGKQIVSRPEAIRKAGSEIAALDVMRTCTSFPSAPSSSKGLVAEGIIQIIDEIEAIRTSINNIITKFPDKLDKVARVIEEKDSVAACQFK